MSNAVRLTTRSLRGDEIGGYLRELAELRITVFREYPYLYDGSLDYELHYLDVYLRSPNSCVILALAQGEASESPRIVGASTAIPLLEADPAFAAPFEQAGLDPTTVFYFGESVLRAEWRGHRLGHAFFDGREAAALAWGARYTAFCAVDRPANHPLRPSDYRPHDIFWTKRGYTRWPAVQVHFPWKDIDEATESSKTLTFWGRPLDEAAP